MPVAAQVMRHASASPGRIAVSGPGGDLTYAELAARAGRAARRLRDEGLADGALVAVAQADPVALLVAVLAADLAGVTPLLCDHAWSEERRAQVMAAVPVAAGFDAPMPEADGPPVRHLPGPDDLTWACFSSGSTGRPRAVVRRRASWTGSFAHLDALAGIGPDDVVLIPGPLVSSLYGFAAVHALAAGATAVVPGRWSPGALAEQSRRATVVHVVPHRLTAVLDAVRAAGGPLRTAVVGGAALDAAARIAAGAAGVRVVSYYGATELSFVAVDVAGSGLRPFPGVEIDVRVPPGQDLGEVWVRSPWLCEGYLAGATGPLRRDDDGWMTVGDLAEPYRPGDVLRLRGRGDGAIQTGGATVVPEDVEEVLRKAPGVDDVVVVGTPHPYLGAVVTAVVEGEGASRTALEAVARAELDPAQRPRRWYAAASLPRTPTGKPARGLVAARLAAGGDPGLRRLG
ncbi:putative acyl--CoA ligase YhfT [Microbispora rosea subsp. aerata]|nr:AMP-binding protein [Microbispora rosea]GGO02148.1 putative acyl--CoA ligase YhfT [Microbispora rosea subsp. aerata]GIH54688.1 putative acyl--CoA ligase YhfT [Microbispora rosea subsp. aerata]GLJ85789.1 putative acyl--CoA ligase YhfT [Microbispora rosea subsp. aerata]